MSIKKKKRRKKRQPQPAQAPPTATKEKVVYQDDFQTGLGQKIEDFGAKFEGKGRSIMYGLAAVTVLVIIAGIFYTWNRRTNNAAQTALGKAIETSQALVTDSPVPAGSTFKTFKTEKARAEASITEFQAIADNYGSPHREKAKYFVAVNRLVIDRPAGIKELEALAVDTGQAGILSKFALAQAKNDDGKLDDAVKLYQELSQLADPIISKETINFELGKIFEKQEKKKEAADLYYSIAKEASEAKDSEGNPLLRALKSITGFRGEANLKTWLFRIAINQSRNRFRWWKSRKREKTVSLDGPIGNGDRPLSDLITSASPNPEEDTLRAERELILKKALTGLPDNYREALILCDIEGLSYEEISTVLEINIGTVKSRISRGREELRRKLKGF